MSEERPNENVYLLKMKKAPFNPTDYWERRLSEQYTLQGVGDISLTKNYNKWSYYITERQFDSILKSLGISSGSVALDIGSGTGFMIEVLGKYTKLVKGVDITTVAIENLQRKYPAFEFQVLNLGKDPYQGSEKFDVITASSVLYHIIDDDELIHLFQQVAELLTEDGVFIFSDIFPHRKEFSLEHQKCRPLSRYMEILDLCGLLLIERRPNYFLFNDPIDSSGKFYKVLWNRLTRWSSRYSWFDVVIWPLLFPLELLLVKICSESPAQEIMVVKRRC